jgi:predicted transcriptional regulator
MARLGDLERSVMDVLWDSDGWLTAREVASRLHHERDLAYTTVLTVLERLERKGFVRRQRAARAHRYRATDAREAVVAEAMLEALGNADDRGSALVRFVGSVSPEEVEILRRALGVPLEGPLADGALGAGTLADDLVTGQLAGTGSVADELVAAGLPASAHGDDQPPGTDPPGGLAGPAPVDGTPTGGTSTGGETGQDETSGPPAAQSARLRPDER